ncbi:MAG: MFS transporter [Clostridia bacterium]|nr:MFS transporter [Clostridia bacterium]
MEKRICPRARAITWMLTLVYFASYLLRINFAVMIVKICSDMSLAETDLAIVLTGLTVAYGGGQLISGLLGDRLKPTFLITLGLVIAVLCNVAMFFAPTVPIMTVVWTVNGFAHSLFWPPIIRLLSTYITDAEYGYANVRISWGSSFGTIFLYLACPLLLTVMPWRTVILCCAGGGAVILVLWLVLSSRLFDTPVRETPVKKEGREARKPLPHSVILPVALIMLAILCQGMLRDGVTNWMPSYMSEAFGLPEEQAILSTVILAVFSVVSFAFFSFVNERLFHDELSCAATTFVAAAIASAVLFGLNFLVSSAAMSMLLMALVVGCMHGINLMLIAYVPRRFIPYNRVSTFSGMLNSCTYVGASISNICFAAIAAAKGWSATVLVWVAVAAIGALLCFAALPLWRHFYRGE